MARAGGFIISYIDIYIYITFSNFNLHNIFMYIYIQIQQIIKKALFVVYCSIKTLSATVLATRGAPAFGLTPALLPF